ncbi:unnamed protein product, partial [Protopolystoma xenopodis]
MPPCSLPGRTSRPVSPKLTRSRLSSPTASSTYTSATPASSRPTTVSPPCSAVAASTASLQPHFSAYSPGDAAHPRPHSSELGAFRQGLPRGPVASLIHPGPSAQPGSASVAPSSSPSCPSLADSHSGIPQPISTPVTTASRLGSSFRLSQSVRADLLLLVVPPPGERHKSAATTTGTKAKAGASLLRKRASFSQPSKKSTTETTLATAVCTGSSVKNIATIQPTTQKNTEAPSNRKPPLFAAAPLPRASSLEPPNSEGRLARETLSPSASGPNNGTTYLPPPFSCSNQQLSTFGRTAFSYTASTNTSQPQTRTTDLVSEYLSGQIAAKSPDQNSQRELQKDLHQQTTAPRTNWTSLADNNPALVWPHGEASCETFKSNCEQILGEVDSSKEATSSDASRDLASKSQTDITG